MKKPSLSLSVFPASPPEVSKEGFQLDNNLFFRIYLFFRAFELLCFRDNLFRFFCLAPYALRLPFRFFYQQVLVGFEASEDGCAGARRHQLFTILFAQDLEKLEAA